VLDLKIKNNGVRFEICFKKRLKIKKFLCRGLVPGPDAPWLGTRLQRHRSYCAAMYSAATLFDRAVVIGVTKSVRFKN
jgi:hypothetical protein